MTHKAFIEDKFWIMSHFECCLYRRFWRSKKVVEVVQIGGRGGNFYEIQKKSSIFSGCLPLQQRMQRGGGSRGAASAIHFSTQRQ